MKPFNGESMKNTKNLKAKITLSVITFFSFALCQQTQTGVIDVVESAIKGTPTVAATAAAGVYEGLTTLGRGRALEGAADIVVGWALLNGAVAYYDYWCDLKRIQSEIMNSRSEKMDMPTVKAALNRLNPNDLYFALIPNFRPSIDTPSVDESIRREIGKLKNLKKQLEPYLTVGSCFGVPQEVRVPFVHISFNRFNVALDRMYKEHIKDSSVQSAYGLQRKINNMELSQLGEMEEKVDAYFKSWTKATVWPFLMLKPSYKFAAELYWNCMAKIAYLLKCQALLHNSGTQHLTVVHAR